MLALQLGLRDEESFHRNPGSLEEGGACVFPLCPLEVHRLRMLSGGWSESQLWGFGEMVFKGVHSSEKGKNHLT